MTLRWPTSCMKTALFVALVAGCSSPVAVDDSDAPIRTDQVRYAFQAVPRGVVVEIPYTFTNTTGAPVFIVNCGGVTGVRLDKRIDGRWVGAWGNVVPSCQSPPIVVDAGESISRTLSVFGGNPGCGCIPRFSVDDREGSYRIVLADVLSSFDADARPFGATVPERLRVSNSFRLTE